MKDSLDELFQRVRACIGLVDGPAERGKKVSMGADGSPTTQIDKLAENTVLTYLEEEGLELNVLSEEIGFVDRGFDKTLVLDPIDGTFNSVIGVPLYTVSMAIGSGSLRGIERAYIRNLSTGDLYYAEEGKGAYLNDERVRSRRGATLGDMEMAMYLGNGTHPEVFKLMRSVRRVRAYGCASIEMALVGTGALDAFLMNSEQVNKRIRVVDIAASHLFLREAGGEVYTLDGELMDMPLDLDSRSNFLAVGDPTHKEVLL